MAVLLALVAALVSGTADYAGGRAATRRSPLSVNFFVQSINAILLPLFAIAIGWDYLHRGDVVLGVVAGVSGGTAYLIFFRALAAGRMSVIAPLTALTTALVPVLVDLFDGVSLRAGRWTGVAMALIAIPALALRRDAGTGSLTLRQEIAYAIGAGIGFAGFFVGIGHTSTESGQWPVAFAALGAVTTMGALCIVRRERLGRPPMLAVLTGLLMVGSSLAINHALQLGPLAVVTVLGSLYPLATSALANRFDHEPIGRINVAGIFVAVSGAALIAVYR
jgi:drug/metabolite transporter (DMT)-like permease